MHERNFDNIPDVKIDQEPEFVPTLNLRQKREHIGVLARALYPQRIAGLVCWYAASKPQFVGAIFDEITADATKRGFEVTTDDHQFLVATRIKKN